MKKQLKLLSQIAIINFLFFFVVVYFLNKQTPLRPTGYAGQAPSLYFASPEPTAEAVSNHNSRSSCWFTIDGQLYDITPYFGSHPGGDEIMLKYCGTDASQAFHTKDKMFPVDHSSSAKAMLQPYLIQ